MTKKNISNGLERKFPWKYKFGQEFCDSIDLQNLVLFMNSKTDLSPPGGKSNYNFSSKFIKMLKRKVETMTTAKVLYS